MTWLTRMYLRTWQHQMTTIMQPFQCELQSQIQETQSTEEEPMRFAASRRQPERLYAHSNRA